MSWRSVASSYLAAGRGIFLEGGPLLESGSPFFTLASLLGGLTPDGLVGSGAYFSGFGCSRCRSDSALLDSHHLFPRDRPGIVPWRFTPACRERAPLLACSSVGSLSSLLRGGGSLLVNVPIGVAILVLAPISLPMGDRARRRLHLRARS